METVLKLLIPIVIQVISSILTPANIKKHGKKLFTLLKDIIIDSETQWDDKALLPIVEMFEEGLGFNDPNND